MISTKLLQDVNIGETLRSYRIMKGLTQIELVAKIQTYGSKLSSNAYSKIERGQANIFIEDFIMLKLVLEFDYSEFFEKYEKIILKKLE